MKTLKIKSVLIALFTVFAIFSYTPSKAEAAVSNAVCTNFYELSRVSSLGTVTGMYGLNFNGYATSDAYNIATSNTYYYFHGLICR